MRKLLDEFKEFAMRGSMVDLAVGFIVGAAFSSVVTSLVNDVLMPPVGLLLGKVDFSNLFVSLTGQHYSSLAAAKAAGAATINYGLFINGLINFIIVALVLFLVIHLMSQLRHKKEAAPQEATTKGCPFCYTDIPVKATRCPNCTSTLGI